MPWYATAISAEGKVKPCCQWRGNYGDFADVSIADAYQSDKSRQLRQELLNGNLPKECGSCSEREQMVGTSRRKWFEDKFTIPEEEIDETTPPKLIQADVNLSNVCNLKCRMCGSWASNQWFEEDRILAKINPDYKKDYSNQTVRQTEVNQLEEILTHAKTLQRIDFKGGEPMLAKNHVEFLEALYAAGGKNILLQYTTNGTVVNQNILDVLGKFKKVRIIFSVEAIGDLYSYIRGGNYTFEQMLETLDKYASLPNVFIGFNVTIQAYNLLHLKALYDMLWEIDAKYDNVSARDAFTTICNSPIYLSPFVLKESDRQEAIKQLEHIDDFKTLCKQLVSNEIHNKHWDTFVNFTNDLDKIRDERADNIRKW